MNANQNNFFKVAMLVLLIIFGVTLISVNAQDKKVKDKIKSIEGDAKKITIVTDKETYTFEADDAALILELLKNNGDEKTFGIYMTDDNEDEQVYVFKSDCDSKISKIDIKKLAKDCKWDLDEKSKSKKVILNDSCGVKIITVTTEDDGKEVVQTYEGKDADEFLEKNKEEDCIKIMESECSGENVMMWNVTKDDIAKMIEIKKKDGVKIVTITTTEDGKEKKEVFEGEEAEKQIEKFEKENDIKVCDDHMIYIESDDDNCKDEDGTFTIKLKGGDCKGAKKIIIKKEDSKDKK